MKVNISPAVAKGSVTVPPSKSMAHRLLIAAAMADGVSRIKNLPECDDVLATLDCLKTMGIPFMKTGDTVTVTGQNFLNISPNGYLNCFESGSTLRFLIPVVGLCGHAVTFFGSERLLQRPLQVYRDIFEKQGLKFEQGKDRLSVEGRLQPGIYELPGNVSSQFITGLLFALPQLNGDSEIRLIPPVESRSYIELTVEALRLFGVRVQEISETVWEIQGNQKLTACDLSVEGDESGAAFLGALIFLGGEVELLGLSENTRQGDRVWRECLSDLRGDHPVISLADCPDLGPLLFAMAAEGGGLFTEVSRLRLKESDRIETMREELSKFGARMIIGQDRVEFLPTKLHAPCNALQGHNDHRVVMALSVLLTKFGGEIEGAQAIAKSYPGFFDDLRAVGIPVLQTD